MSSYPSQGISLRKRIELRRGALSLGGLHLIGHPPVDLDPNQLDRNRHHVVTVLGQTGLQHYGYEDGSSNVQNLFDLPFNHNRMLLSTQDGRSADRRYINASYIEEPLKNPSQQIPRSWIAAQAPIADYVANFLSMLIYAPQMASRQKQIPSYTDLNVQRPLITFEDSNWGMEGHTPGPRGWPTKIGQVRTWSSDISGPGASSSNLTIAVTLLSQTAWTAPVSNSFRKWRVNILQLQHAGRRVQVRHLEVWSHVEPRSLNKADGNELREALLDAIDAQFAGNPCPIAVYQGKWSMLAGSPAVLFFLMSALTAVFRNLHTDQMLGNREGNALMTLRSVLARSPLGVPAGSKGPSGGNDGSSSSPNPKYEDVSSLRGIDPILGVMDYLDDHRIITGGSDIVFNEIYDFGHYWWDKHCEPQPQPECRLKTT